MPVQASSYQNRVVIDSNFTNSTAIGTAGSTVQSAAFDTGDNTDGFFPEHVELIVAFPALPSLAAPGVNTSLTVNVLADTATTPTTALPLSFTIAGTAGTGAAAVTKNFRLPGGMARYLAVQVVAGANSGNNSAISYQTSLGF